MIPYSANFFDIALLLLRLLAGAIFAASGWNDLKDPVGRGKGLGLSREFTLFLGAAEIAGALGLVFGVLTQVAAIGLILLMLGAIHRKIFVWHTGFWGKNGTDGAHYDLMLALMCLVIVASNGGRFVLMK